MKICFFGSYDRSYSRNQILLKGLKKTDIEVNEVHLDLPKLNIDKPNHLGLGVMLKRLIRKFRLIPITLLNFKKIKESDVILAATPTQLDMPLAYLVSRILHKPLIFDSPYALSIAFVGEFGLAPKASLQAKLLSMLDKLTYRLADYIIFDTETARNLHCKVFNIPVKKTLILPLGADSDIYRYSGVKTNENSLNVVYYGLYNPMHGVEYIIAAANILKDKKEIKFTMLGNGQTYEENKKKADELKLKNVIFYPDVTETNAKEYLDSADVFLGFLNKSQSAEISFPNKVFQGLALGKAVITVETKITKNEFKHKENIYLVKAQDAAALAKAITELHEDKKLLINIAENGNRLFKSKYTTEAIGKKFRQILQNINYEK